MPELTKACKACLATKPIADFYKQKSGDGWTNKCRSCIKSQVTEHRERNIERVREYDRRRASLAHRVEARRDYQETEAFRRSHRAANERYRLKKPNATKARNAVGNALRDGKLFKWPACAVPDCDSPPEAHHPDYDQHLSVVWLCDCHHKQAHKETREIDRQNRKTK